MEEAVDVKALRARFHAKAKISDSSRDSGSPKSPLPAFGIGGFLAEGDVTANGVARNKMSSLVPSPPLGRGSPVVPRFPRHISNDAGSGSSPRPQLPQGVFPRLPASTPPPPHGARTKALPSPFQPSEVAETKLKLTGAMLQNKMLKHQGPSPAKPGPSGPPLLPSQKIRSEVVPLRRPLPPERLRPMKPKRPPHVSLDQYQRNNRVPPTPPGRTAMRRTDGSSSSGSSSLSLSGLVSPIGPPRPPNKPSSLPRHHIPVFKEGDDEETYDDIDLPPPPPPPPHMRSFDKSDSWKDSSSSQFEMESDESDVYDTIDEEQGAKSSSLNRKTEREMKRLKEQELKNLEKIHKKEKEYKKKFKLSGEVKVIHTATVRHDWQGDKHDLSVQQGEIIEIIRIENNPIGMWLGRTTTGNYGYISISCVDLDYEDIKRKYRDSRQSLNPFPLPPAPPDPLQHGDVYYHVDSSDHRNSMNETDDDYDDVEQMFKEFPPPPLEISLDPKSEKEMRTKFKLNGPIKVLHTMMVDSNANIKKPGGKDLAVVQGDILDVIQITNKKKALCRNRLGKYGYVPRVLLLQMEGDVYDDVEHISDIYDNDNVR